MNTYLLISLCCLIFTLVLAYSKKVEQLKRYRLTTTNYEDKVIILSGELKEIASHYKYVIEKWELSAKENHDLKGRLESAMKYVSHIENQIKAGSDSAS